MLLTGSTVMECQDSLVSYLSWSLVFGGVAFLLHQVRQNHTMYGRYSSAGGYTCPAKLAWFLQEVPAFLMPLGLLLLSPETRTGTMARLSLFAFLLHYFHR